MRQKTKILITVISIALVAILSLSLVAAFIDDSKKSPQASETTTNEVPTLPPVEKNTIFGVSWNKSGASVTLERLASRKDDYVTVNVVGSPQPGKATSNGSSFFDNYYPWCDMKEYNVIDNEIAYSSDDREFSRTLYDTVVYIPKFYYKVVDDVWTRKFYIAARPEEGFELHPGSGNYVGKYYMSKDGTSISGVAPLTNITRAQAREAAEAKGDRWSQYDYATWNAIQMLMLVEYATWDVQAFLGKGMVDATKYGFSTAPVETGLTDGMWYHTGSGEGEWGYSQVQYRHIEGLWGGMCQWVDGVNFYDREVYISLDYHNYADDTAEGYTLAGVKLPATGYISGVGHSTVFPWAYIPNKTMYTTDYSVSMYIADKLCSTTGWAVLYTSNNNNGGGEAGLFRFGASSASDRVHATYGARLVFHGE